MNEHPTSATSITRRPCAKLPKDRLRAFAHWWRRRKERALELADTLEHCAAMKRATLAGNAYAAMDARCMEERAERLRRYASGGDVEEMGI